MDTRALELHSPLYDRYNGFLLGAIFTAAYGAKHRARFPLWRRQLQALLDEIEAGVQLPHDHESFTRDHAELTTRVLGGIGECSPQLKNFFLLGSASHQWLVLEDDETRRELRSLGRRVLDAHELSRDLWDQALRADRSGRDPLRQIMRLLSATLRNVCVEEETCFVALPPGEVYSERYELFFAELLRVCGRRALRSWSGFGGERRQEMLVQVLRRTGALLADVSGYAPGVVFELGVARGAGARVYLFTSTPEQSPPFDLDLSWVRSYEPGAANWRHTSLEDGVYFLSAVDAVLDGSSETLGDADPEAVISRLRQAERFATEGLAVEPVSVEGLQASSDSNATRSPTSESRADQ